MPNKNYLDESFMPIFAVVMVTVIIICLIVLFLITAFQFNNLFCLGLGIALSIFLIVLIYQLHKAEQK